MSAEPPKCGERFAPRHARAGRRCEREATHWVHWLGVWRPVCSRHRRYFSDLPSVAASRFDPATYPNDR